MRDSEVQLLEEVAPPSRGRLIMAVALAVVTLAAVGAGSFFLGVRYARRQAPLNAAPASPPPATKLEPVSGQPSPTVAAPNDASEDRRPSKKGKRKHKARHE